MLKNASAKTRTIATACSAQRATFNIQHANIQHNNALFSDCSPQKMALALSLFLSFSFSVSLCLSVSVSLVTWRSVAFPTGLERRCQTSFMFSVLMTSQLQLRSPPSNWNFYLALSAVAEACFV